MSDSSRSSYNNPQFKPFQSGSTLCHPSKDYSDFKGGSNTLISSKPGKNFYKEQSFKVSKDDLSKTILGKGYATSAGGAKKKKSKAKPKAKPKAKTSLKKGGNKFQSSPQPIESHQNLTSEVHTHGVSGPASVGHSQANHSQANLSQAKNALQNKLSDIKNVMSGGKRRKYRKNMKGGKETEGATGMPSNFYTGKLPDGYVSTNGNGIETPYGIIDAKDAGVGNLAPYNTSKNASKLTMIKTGGKKKSSKQSKSKKGGLIPKMSDRPFKLVDSVVNTGASSLKSFLKQLEKNYDKSLVKIQQTRNGLNRLSQGGTKKKATNKKKSLKGGDGSDFAATLNSRGPSNAPDQGEKMFRVFNKTGEYIPNSQLAKAAAPKLTSGPKVTKVMGFDPSETTFAPITGGKKTVAKKTMKKKSVAKKPVKKTTTKKKSTTKKPVKKTTTKKSTTKKPVKKTTTKKKSTKK